MSGTIAVGAADYCEGVMSDEQEQPRASWPAGEIINLHNLPGYDHIFEDDFNAVDSSLFSFHFGLIDDDESHKSRFIRAQRNLGYVMYYLRDTRERIIWGLTIVKLDFHRLRLLAYVNTELVTTFTAEELATEYMQYRMRERALPTSPPLVGRSVGVAQLLPASPKRPGRPLDNSNAWAHHELARGADRAAIFLQWAERRGIDLSDPSAAKRARETFKRAMSRMGHKGT